MDMNPCALGSPRPQLFNAQEFISISRTVASENSIENAFFCPDLIFCLLETGF